MTAVVIFDKISETGFRCNSQRRK